MLQARNHRSPWVVRRATASDSPRKLSKPATQVETEDLSNGLAKIRIQTLDGLECLSKHLGRSSDNTHVPKMLNTIHNQTLELEFSRVANV